MRGEGKLQVRSGEKRLGDMAAAEKVRPSLPLIFSDLF